MPLDVVFGTYNSDSRWITIYEKNIVHHSQRLGWDPCLLMTVVRLHGRAHAVDNLGLPSSLETWLLFPRGGARKTNRKAYSLLRTAWFQMLDSPCHEYLAQAIIYSVLNSLIGETVAEKSRYVEMFDGLEAKQPLAYHLNSSEKPALLSTNWKPTLSLLVLHALGSEGFMTQNPVPLDSSANWREACAALCLVNSEPTWIIDGTLGELKVVSDVTLFGPKITRSPSDEQLEYLVGRLGALKFSIFSKEHPPPHFNVRHGNESANFRLGNGEQTNGGLPRYQGQIRDYYGENRRQLIARWNNRRPANCPVGTIEP